MIAHNVLIVEDDAIIAEDLRDILESQGYNITGVASNADRAIELLNFRLPDIVLLDITLKQNSSGLDVARAINKEYHIPFIYITSYSDQKTVDEAIGTDPSGYIVKPFQSKDILPTIKLALSTHVSKVARSFPSMDKVNNLLTKPITAQEYATLILICEGKTNPQIAETLFISVNTVKTHIKRIYTKLRVDSKLTATQWVMKMR